jgi:hypothetical protein
MSVPDFVFALFAFRVFFCAEVLVLLNYGMRLSIVGIIEKITIIALIFCYIPFLLKKQKCNKELLCCLFIFAFYLLYSVYTNLNSYTAIMDDIFNQLKPFLIFYLVYEMADLLNAKQRQLLRLFCIFNFGLNILVVILSPNERHSVMGNGYDVPLTATMCFLVYLWASDRKKSDFYLAFIMLFIGLATTRSRNYGFVVMALGLFWFMKNKPLNLSLKTIIPMLTISGLVFYVGWEKIQYYMIEGSEEGGAYIRAVLYIGSFAILNDFIPFGSGFGTFGTASSMYGKNLSPLYYQYSRIDTILEQDWIDAMYPMLAQVGWLGVALFFYFFIRRVNQSSSFSRNAKDVNHKIVFAIVAFFAIEHVGFPTMYLFWGTNIVILLAFVLKDEKLKIRREQCMVPLQL